MAKSKPILLTTYTADAAVPRRGLCLVASGVNAGNVAAPAGASVTKFVGVSQEPTPSGIDPNRTDNTLSVMIEGVSPVESDGSAVINTGDYLEIANATGQVRSVVPDFGGATVHEIVGRAESTIAATVGLYVDMKIERMLHRP